jgi:NitT/TauT family transport system permease protein
VKAPDLAPLIGGLAILGFWEGAVRLTGVATYLLPPPTAIAKALVTGAPVLVPSAVVTLGLALQALLFAMLMGVGLAVLFSRIKWLGRALGPYALVLQATPVVAIAPLVIIWTGVENPRTAILILATIVAFFPVLANATAGLAAIDPGLDRLFRLHRAKPLDRFLRLEVPTAAPYLLAGIETAAGLALVGAVVAEFVAGTGATGGLAWRIVEAGNRLETPTMFAALILLAIMGVLLATTVGWARKRLA